jgi:hypothetical protein
MTGNAINAKSEALNVRELSSEELDRVSGGSGLGGIMGGGGPMGMINQIMQMVQQQQQPTRQDQG